MAVDMTFLTLGIKTGNRNLSEHDIYVCIKGNDYGELSDRNILLYGLFPESRRDRRKM